MPEFQWSSGIRDTTEFPEMDIFIRGELRSHLEAFCLLDGVGWTDFPEQIAVGGLGTYSRARTYRKLYERLGLIFKDGDEIRLSRLGKDIRDLKPNVEAAYEKLLNQIRVLAIDVLARYQLRNPVDGKNLPVFCDVQPYVCIWKVMRALDNKISFEELNRVMLHIPSMSQLDGAIQKIRNARKKCASYKKAKPQLLDELLGPPTHTSQDSARIAPWFSLAGWGGLIIERKNDADGFRRLVPEAIGALDRKLANLPPYFDAGTEEEWLRYYIGNVGAGADAADDRRREPDETRRAPGGTNLILYGVPGCGKSRAIKEEYCGDESRTERVVFYPDYTYSDFVGQILPVLRDEKVRYEFVPGPFTRILKKAYLDEANRYYLIVEEINRGNAPAIFGDVFQLLDRVSEPGGAFPIGTSEYPVTNADIAKEVYGDADRKVRIPSNLSIIGTMNTSDQNVFTLDTAFQRRWTMRLIPNSFRNHKFADQAILDTDVSWKAFCAAVNEEILRRDNALSSEDKRLGVYFVTADDLTRRVGGSPEARRLNARFAEKVLKYLWDDAFRFARNETFNTKAYASLELVIEAFCSQRGNARFGVFSESLERAVLDAAAQSPAETPTEGGREAP